MHRRLWLGSAPGALLGLAAGALLGLAGCVTAPEKIEVSVDGGRRPPPVDSSRVPATASHEEARHELAKAYENIRYLEEENRRLEEKARKYKREREDCEKRLDRYED